MCGCLCWERECTVILAMNREPYGIFKVGFMSWSAAWCFEYGALKSHKKVFRMKTSACRDGNDTTTHLHHPYIFCHFANYALCLLVGWIVIWCFKYGSTVNQM